MLLLDWALVGHRHCSYVDEDPLVALSRSVLVVTPLGAQCTRRAHLIPDSRLCLFVHNLGVGFSLERCLPFELSISGFGEE